MTGAVPPPLQRPTAGSAAAPPALSRATLRRRAEQRADPAALAAAWASADARVLLLREGRGGFVVHVAEEVAGPLLVPRPPADAGEEGLRLYLGEDEAGAPRWAVVAQEAPRGPLGTRQAGLRDVGAALPALDAAWLGAASALATWHATHPRCPRCGEPTEAGDGGWVRRCASDGSTHFPRTDPAVIMLPEDGERCLVSRAAAWPPGRFSCLAGFVEPGESLEQAVVREVEEEVGLHVVDLAYRTSQPWPPASLMLAFVARVAPGDVGPGDGEIAETRWYDRAGLAAAAASGEVRLPPPVSVAHRLLSDWAGQELPGRW